MHARGEWIGTVTVVASERLDRHDGVRLLEATRRGLAQRPERLVFDATALAKVDLAGLRVLTARRRLAHLADAELLLTASAPLASGPRVLGTGERVRAVQRVARFVAPSGQECGSCAPSRVP